MASSFSSSCLSPSLSSTASSTTEQQPRASQATSTLVFPFQSTTTVPISYNSPAAAFMRFLQASDLPAFIGPHVVSSQPLSFSGALPPPTALFSQKSPLSFSARPPPHSTVTDHSCFPDPSSFSGLPHA